MIEPKTHKKSVSFGNPSWTVLRAPAGTGLVFAFNYFLFSEGTTDKTEQQSLLFYHKLEEKDFDEDGMDDQWEYEHTGGLSFFNQQNANNDFNENGLSAQKESVRSLNPFEKVKK